jgi:hypothetical protein
MRIINRTKNLWRVPQHFMKIINLSKSSWNSIWISHHGHQHFLKDLWKGIKQGSSRSWVVPKVQKDSRGSSTARRLLKGLVTSISRTKSLWKRTYRKSSGLPTFFQQASQTIWKTFQFINNFKRVSEVLSRNYYFMDLTMYTRS